MAGIIGGLNTFSISKPIIISMLSGGLDSAGVLWLLLNEEKYKSFHIHVHHINILNIERRDKVEYKAVSKILKKLEENGYQFSFSQGVQDFRFLHQIGFPLDMDICAFVASQMARNIPNVNHIAMGRTISDISGASPDFNHRMERAQKIFKGALDGGADASYIFPAVKYSKREIYDKIPDYLQNNFWSCRKPVEKEYGKYTPCGKCHACEDLKKYNIPHN